MKSPKEALLGNHSNAIPALDAIRGRVVAEARAPVIGFTLAGLAREAWTQLFWRGRMSWGAIAAVWIGLFIVRGVASDEVTTPPVKSVRVERREVDRWLERQAQLRAELGLPVESRATLPSRRKPVGPQSMNVWRDVVV